MSLLDLVHDARATMLRAYHKYDPSHIFALFSGGHDSLVASNLAIATLPVNACVHINTGIGIEQTRQFVRETCQEWGIPLLEYRAAENTKADGTPDPQVYEELVLEHGFPGPTMHTKMYNRLKQRSIERLIREHKTHRYDRILLITGVRKQESVRRMGYVDEIQRRGSTVWVAPLANWSKVECNRFIDMAGLRRNQVVDLLHMSGECLCGAYARKDELEEIRRWFPDVAEYLDSLSDRVNEAGFPWRWEDTPPDWWGQYKQGQQFLDETFMLLCMACHKRRAPVETMVPGVPG